MIKVGEIFRQKMVQTIKEGVSSKKSAFVFNYKGLKANKVNDLRKELGKKDARVYVTRKNIAGIALKELEANRIAEALEGQTAFVWSDSDVVDISKTLTNFAKDCDGVVIRGGLLDGDLLTESDVTRLSDLPSREVLLAQLLGTIQAPLTRLASVLNGNTRDLLSVLKQLSEQKGGN